MGTAFKQLLDQQLELLDQEASADRWQQAHEMATRCRETEDLIALALETFDRIKRRRTSLTGSSLLEYMRRWHDIGLRALGRVEEAERTGSRPDRADDLRFAINEASIAADFDRVKAAWDRLDETSTHTLDEVLDALPPDIQ